MRSSGRRIARFFGLLACSAGLLLASCSKKPSEAIIGKWRAQTGGNVIEFRKDGSVSISQRGQTIRGTYKFTDDSHFKMDMTMQIPPGQKANLPSSTPDSITVAADCTAQISGEFLDVSATMSMAGEPPHTEKTRLKRIK